MNKQEFWDDAKAKFKVLKEKVAVGVAKVKTFDKNDWQKVAIGFAIVAVVFYAISSAHAFNAKIAETKAAQTQTQDVAKKNK